MEYKSNITFKQDKSESKEEAIPMKKQLHDISVILFNVFLTVGYGDEPFRDPSLRRRVIYAIADAASAAWKLTAKKEK